MKQYSALITVAALALIIVLFISNAVFITLKPGEKGIVFRKFTSGLDKDNVHNAGFHVIAPWNEMYIYDVKEQKIEETMDVLDKNGLSIVVDISVRFYPVHTEIGELHEKFGKSYISKLVVPEVRSAVRRVMGRYTAEEIYSTKRTEVETSIITESEEVLIKSKNNIQMTALLIRSINLPAQLKKAIENKQQQEQEALAHRFKLEKAKIEAERMKIAALGEAAANKIINSSLTNELLKMRGIEATIELSKSPNAKVIVIGSSKEGLPLILGNN